MVLDERRERDWHFFDGVSSYVTGRLRLRTLLLAPSVKLLLSGQNQQRPGMLADLFWTFSLYTKPTLVGKTLRFSKITLSFLEVW